MDLVLLRFFESVSAALAVGLLLLPRLGVESLGARFRLPAAALATLRFLLGFALIVAIARAIVPADRALDLSTLTTFCLDTTVGRAWIGTQILAFAFAATAFARLVNASRMLDVAALALGGLVLAATSVTGHAIDDSFAWWMQASFLFHTLAGLTWIGGLIGLVWWMLRGARDASPETVALVAERWSLVAKVAVAVVFITGLAMAWENVGGFANLLATPYGRLLTLKLLLLAAALFAALALARYLTRRPAGVFDAQWYGRVGFGEATAAVGLLFLAGWIAVITPASHETDLWWPLPFRLSWAATWGYVGMKLPGPSVTGWYLAPAWSGVVALVFAAIAAALGVIPRAGAWRRIGAPIALALAALGVFSSFTTLAYPDTYADPAVDYTADSIVRGRKDFAQNCVGCHGVTGEGNGELAKGLSTPPADLTAPHVGNHTIGDIFHWLTFGGTSGVMPGFKDTLDADDRWDVINYLLVMSYSNQARFLGSQIVVPWLIAPDFQLDEAKNDQVTTLWGLRQIPTLASFARCNAQGGDEAALEASLEIAAQSAKAAGAHHVTIYQGGCPEKLFARTPVHPKAVESAFAVFNRYPNEFPSDEIPEAHFLVDRSGYVRARFRHFEAADGARMQQEIAVLAKEPFVVVSLHSH